jgi:predicted Zn-dependent protease
MKFSAIMLFVIILGATVIEVQAQTPPQDTFIIEVGGYTWNKTTLKTLIVTAENQTWWTQGLADSTLRAINQWNEAIQFFATNYSSYAYLSNVKLEVMVANQHQPDYDIYINYSQSVAINGQDSIGLATTIPYNNGTIEKCVINLAAESQYLVLTEKDIQSVATHELGHALCIGHSNSSSDLMYPSYDVYAAQYAISTLDLYGVARAFEWINDPNLAAPLRQQQLALPPDIPYRYAPVSQLAPETILDNPIAKFLEMTGRILLNPIILLMIIVAIILFVIVGLSFRKKKTLKPKTRSN